MEFSTYIKKAAEDIKNTTSALVEKAENLHNKYKTEAELDELYKTLGKIRYEELIKNTDASEEAQKITEEITRLKEKLASYQSSSSSVRVCIWCGKTSPAGSETCEHCGYEFNK